MLFGRHRLAVVVILVCILASVAEAQRKIPYGVVTATTALTPAQQAHVEDYLDDKTQALTEGNPDEVVQARQELIEPLAWAGGTDIFHLAYSAAASHRLTQAVNSDQLHVRLNAMIVVSSLHDPGVVRLIQKGLADPSPAIRYWAGKAVDVGVTSRLSVREQQILLKALTDAMLKEKSERVLQRLLVGLVGLDIPEAAMKLLDGLNTRVDLHALNPNLPLGAALEGLRKLFVKTVQAKSEGREIPVGTIREMALVAFRYMTLSATLLDMNRVSQESNTYYQDMIKLADAMLGWTARQMPPEDGLLPMSIKSEVSTQDWPLIRLRSEEWKRVLMKAPFNFGPVDLIVAVPDHAP